MAVDKGASSAIEGALKIILNDNHKLYSVCTQELRKTETTLRTERDQWRDQATANKHEVEKLRGMTELSVILFSWCKLRDKSSLDT